MKCVKNNRCFLPPATKLRQGNVFTPVWHSVHKGVWQTPLARPPPPREQTSLGCSACWEIRATIGRYTSYWNAYLFKCICNFVGAIDYYYGTQLRYAAITINTTINDADIGYIKGLPLRDRWEEVIGGEVSNNFRLPIGRSKETPGMRPPGGPNSFIFMYFSAKKWVSTTTLGVGAPSGNPGSATVTLGWYDHGAIMRKSSFLVF